MAKVIGTSSFGKISGKLNNFVFVIRNGKQFVRKIPKKRNTPYSPKEINVHLILSFLNSLYSNKLKPIVHKYWQDACSLKKLKMTPANFFTKENFYPLIHSMPDRNKVFSKNNMPDLSEILVTPWQAKLIEPTFLKKTLCRDASVTIEWDTNIYRQGSPDDIANVIVIYLPPIKLFRTFKLPHNFPWTPHLIKITTPKYSAVLKEQIKIWVAQGKREDGKLICKIPPKINPKYLTAFLFFSNKNSCSQSSVIKL